MRCDSCRLAKINGRVCHETGCPAAWRTEVRECRACGTPFRPDSRAQHECSEECTAAYHGLVSDAGGES